MIFVTVGAQMPFDRLVRTVDRWAGETGRDDIFAQIGDTDYRPAHMQWVASLDRTEYRTRCEQADVIIAHAGMGSIITALELGKPILVMPRQGQLMETRNDHQIATAKRFSDRRQVTVADDESQLATLLSIIDTLAGSDVIDDKAPSQLTDRLHRFIVGNEIDAKSRNDVGRDYDGVICFGGEDWWYHNRGHYDMQMMGQFAKYVPTLYINSIGMRTPSLREGGVFFARVARKLSSFQRGFQWVGANHAVFSPVTAPALRCTALGRSSLTWQVRAAARRCGITRPLVWINCPTAGELIDDIPHELLVYQRTDRYEQFPGADAAYITRLDRQLKQQADMTLFCSSTLYEAEADQCAAARFVDHGVDFEHFHRAEGDIEPDDVRSISRPRVVYVGGIDAHTFDPQLLLDVADRLPDAQFVLVGGCSLPDGWCTARNVHLLGKKPYEQVPAYMACGDVLIMPWNRSEWIEACNPVKLKEYLAVGRPVVSTPFGELRRYEGLVHVADDADAFADQIHRALADRGDIESGRQRVRHETWTAKFHEVLTELHAAGRATHPRSHGDKLIHVDRTEHPIGV